MDPEKFATLTDEEFAQLSTEEQLAYLDWLYEQVTGDAVSGEEASRYNKTPTEPSKTPTKRRLPWEDSPRVFDPYQNKPQPGVGQPESVTLQSMLNYLKAQQVQLQKDIDAEDNPVYEETMTRQYNANASQIRMLEKQLAGGGSGGYSPSSTKPTVNTTAPYIPEWNEETQRWEMKPNINYQEPAGNAAANANAATSAQRLDWEIRRALAQDALGERQFQQTHDWNVEAAEKKRGWDLEDLKFQSELAREAQQAQTRNSLFGQLGNQFMQSLPHLAQPGQVYYSGYEPGGVMSQIFGNMGMKYDPEQYRAPIVSWDPEEMWRRAQRMAAAQQVGG